MTLTEFVLARIAEDDAAARGAGADAMTGFRWKHYPKDAYDEVQALTLAQSHRVLAECEAKRRIVEEHPLRGWAGREVCDTCVQKDEMGDPVDDLDGRQQCNTLRALAVIYADHPDYREDWRP